MIFKSGAWSIFGTLSERVFTVATYVMVSRQVEPLEFGHLVLVLLVMQLLSYFASFGVKDNLVRTKNLTPNLLSNSLLFVLLVSFVFILTIIFVLAPISMMYSGQDLALLFLIFALQPALMCISEFYQGILIRDQRFKELALRNSFVALVSGIVGMILAIYNFGIFAIIVARYVYYSLDVLVVFFLAGLRPVIGYNAKEFKDIWQFGWRLSLSQILNFSGAKITEVICTIFLGPIYLAVVDVGRKFILTFYSAFLTPLNNVSLSYLSKSMSPVDNYNSFVRVVVLIFIPVIALMGFFSEQIISIVFGSKWLESIPVLTILALAVVPQISMRFMPNICIKFGRTDVVLIFNIVNVLILFVSGVFAMMFSENLEDLMYSIVIGVYISSLFKIYYTSMRLGISAIPSLLMMMEGLMVYGVVYAIAWILKSFVFIDFPSGNSIEEIAAVLAISFIVMVVYVPYALYSIKSEMVNFR